MGKRYSLYLPSELEGMVEDIAKALTKQGEYGLMKRDGSANLSAVIQISLENEAKRLGLIEEGSEEKSEERPF